MEFDTIAAISTPLGEGAIAIVRLSGDDAIEKVDRIFKGKRFTEVLPIQFIMVILVDPRNK